MDPSLPDALTSPGLSKLLPRHGDGMVHLAVEGHRLSRFIDIVAR